MLMEGTGIYFLLIFLIFLVVYITVKICLGYLLKRAHKEAWKGYIPIYTTYVLVDFLNLKKSVFYMSLIPIVNLYYYNIIIKKLLEGFRQDPNDSIWYIIIPMYKFPELVFKNPKYVVNEYDLTNQFLETQNVLFNKPKEELPDEIKLVDVNKAVEEKMNETIIEPSNFNQTIIETNPIDNNPNDINNYINQNTNEDNIYTKPVTEEEKKQVTYVEAVNEEVKEEKPAMRALDEGANKICPNCGTKLAPSATTCFMCGQKII